MHALITGTDLGTKGRVDEVIWQSDPDAMHPGEIVEVPRSAHWDLVLGPANAHWIINRTGEAGRWTLVAPPASLGLSDLKTLGWGFRQTLPATQPIGAAYPSSEATHSRTAWSEVSLNTGD